MKFSNYLAVSAAAVASVEAGQIKRQAKCAMPAAPPPEFRTNAQRKYFSVGTYSLRPNPGNAGKGKAMGGMGGMMGEGDSQSFMASPSGTTFCGTCTVLSGRIVLFYPDGSPANVTNGVYTHHILTNGVGAQPAFVKSGAGGFAGATGAGFVGAGDDNGNRPWVYTPKTNDKFESGYHLTPSTRFSAQIVLVNYNKVAKTVCVAYDLEYLPGLVGKKVKSSLISAAGLTGPKTDRSRAVNTTSSPMAFSEGGYIVSAKGHLHDGGSAMYMTIAGKNRYNCVSTATYGHTVGSTGEATISDMSDCNHEPWRIDSGDTMRMTAEYDLKKHPLRETTGGGEGGVMGMFRIIFAPDKNW